MIALLVLILAVVVALADDGAWHTMTVYDVLAEDCRCRIKTSEMHEATCSLI